MPTILFPTDFSDAATRAFVYALQLADRIDAKIITLHVFEKPDISGLTHVPLSLEEFYNTIDLYEFENYKDAVPVLDKIQDDSYYLRVPEVRRDSVMMKFQYILKHPDKELERVIRRKTVRKIVEFISAREKIVEQLPDLPETE